MTNYGIRSLGLMGASTLLLLAACSKKNTPGSFAHASLPPSLAKFVTADALAVAEVELAALRATPLFERHRDELGSLAPDGISELVLVWDGNRLLILQKDHHGDIRLSGSLEAVARARQTASNGSGKLSQELAAPLHELPGSAQVWAVTRGLPLQGVPLPSEYASLLANFRGYLQTTGIALQTDSAIHLLGRVDCVSERGSRRVYDALRAGLAFARLANQRKDAFAASLCERFHVDREGTTVHITADFPAPISDELLRRALRTVAR
jgi:hypothetical protein